MPKTVGSLPRILLNLFFTVVFFGFLFIYLPDASIAAYSPWVLDKGETVITGTFLGYTDNQLQIDSGEGPISYSFDSQLTIAMMGYKTGLLLSGPDEIPTDQRIELFLNTHGLVRAIRNIQQIVPNTHANALDSRGEDATLSPHGDYFTLYSPQLGLSVYSVAEQKELRRLGPLPIAAWNGNGQIATVSDSHLIIFDPAADKISRYPLPGNKVGMRLVGLELAWNPSGDRLLLRCLRDYPDRCSDVMQIFVFDNQGRNLASHFAPYMSDALWLNDRDILYAQCEDQDEETGWGVLWNYDTGGSKIILPKIQKGYHNLAYSSKFNTLAYTIEKSLGEELYTLSLNSSNHQRLNTFHFPVRNVQWSNAGDLYYWDEFNNHICKIDSNGNRKIIASGYLPPQATGKGLVFFPEEPVSQSLQLFYLP